MIRRLLARLLPGTKARTPRIYERDRHAVRSDQLSNGTRNVIRRLHENGFKAFVVGGAVRDLLLGIAPKDFDIATDATPEQVKPLFRRAFIVGRRFRLVHVHLGNEVLEVSTFRAAQTGDDATDEHGRLLSDNVYGSQAEDALRRDFTINALYFDPDSETVWDYVGGVADIRAHRLKLIGPPVTRYREDPVRMLRAVRLAAKLGLAIDPRTEEPIARLAALMHNVPPARLFDEMQKLLLSGHAVDTVRSLRSHGLSHGLLPLLDVILEQPLGERFVTLALAQTDERVLTERPVSPAFLFAALLWHEVLAAWKGREGRGERSIAALENAMDEVLDTQCAKLAITRKLTATMREVWSMQPRFDLRSGQRPYRLIESPRFRMAYDFPALRAASGEVPAEMGAWWRAFQAGDPDTRKAMLLPETGTRKRRRRRRKKRPATPAPSPA